MKLEFLEREHLHKLKLEFLEREHLHKLNMAERERKANEQQRATRLLQEKPDQLIRMFAIDTSNMNEDNRVNFLKLRNQMTQEAFGGKVLIITFLQAH